jgi:hypothetical protein
MPDAATVRIPKTVYTEVDAATYIGYAPHYLREARRRGYGPVYIRIDRAIRYRRHDLDAWLEAHKVEPRAPNRVAALAALTPQPADHC